MNEFFTFSSDAIATAFFEPYSGIQLSLPKINDLLKRGLNEEQIIFCIIQFLSHESLHQAIHNLFRDFFEKYILSRDFYSLLFYIDFQASADFLELFFKETREVVSLLASVNAIDLLNLFRILDFWEKHEDVI